jgi:hypothetical protein
LDGNSGVKPDHFGDSVDAGFEMQLPDNSKAAWATPRRRAAPQFPTIGTPQGKLKIGSPLLEEILG